MVGGLTTITGGRRSALDRWRQNLASGGSRRPRRLAQFGLVISLVMALGFLTGPGILVGVDAMDSSPWCVTVGLLGGLGWFILYPFWRLWLGRVLTSTKVA
jgi:hypothetical protein